MSEAPVPRGGRQRFAFAMVGLGLLMTSMDTTMVAVALPAVERELGIGINWSAWIVTIYVLGQIIARPIAGRLTDLYGARQVFVIGAVVFTLASLACSVVSSIYLLIALRAVQALGGGSFLPSATGIVATLFPRDRDRAIGLFSSIIPLGAVLGPLIGSLLIALGSWRWVFLVNAPVAAIVVLTVLLLVPRSEPTGERGLIDIAGAALLAGALLALMLAITSAAHAADGVRGWVQVVLSLIVCGGLGMVLALRSTRVRHPIIPAELVTGRTFASMNTLNVIFGAAAIGVGSMLPLYAHERFAVSDLESGAVLTARAIGMISVAGVAAFALRRTGYRMPIVAGFGLIGSGLIALAVLPAGTPFWLLAAVAAVMGVGMGFSAPASNNAGLSLRPEQMGAIVGLRGMFKQAGSILSVSTTTSVMAASLTPGIAQAGAFATIGVLLLLAIPLVRFIPNNRGAW